jgi:CheY-like chemotaxis protein
VLILLDLHLPDMGGADVLQRLRDDPQTASIPVAIISADATPGQVQRLLNAGAAAYLTKPIDVRELLAVLDAALTHAASV